MKIGITFFISFVTLLVLLYIFNPSIFTNTKTNIEQVTLATDEKNAVYQIDGIAVALKDGVSEVEAAPQSASKIITHYFGNEVRHDFNADGRIDVAFLLTQTTGGSGTFFYEVVALNMPNGYVGSKGFFLGDRIAPQSSHMGTDAGEEDVLVVNYADRNLDEDFATPPSVGKSVWLIFNTETMLLEEMTKSLGAGIEALQL